MNKILSLRMSFKATQVGLIKLLSDIHSIVPDFRADEMLKADEVLVNIDTGTSALKVTLRSNNLTMEFKAAVNRDIEGEAVCSLYEGGRLVNRNIFTEQPSQKSHISNAIHDFVEGLSSRLNCTYS